MSVNLRRAVSMVPIQRNYTAAIFKKLPLTNVVDGADLCRVIKVCRSQKLQLHHLENTFDLKIVVCIGERTTVSFADVTQSIFVIQNLVHLRTYLYVVISSRN